jgi:hypothetical protein
MGPTNYNIDRGHTIERVYCQRVEEKKEQGGQVGDCVLHEDIN